MYFVRLFDVCRGLSGEYKSHRALCEDSLSPAIMVRFLFVGSSDGEIRLHLIFWTAFRPFAWQILLFVYSKATLQIYFLNLVRVRIMMTENKCM